MNKKQNRIILLETTIKDVVAKYYPLDGEDFHKTHNKSGALRHIGFPVYIKPSATKEEVVALTELGCAEILNKFGQDLHNVAVDVMDLIADHPWKDKYEFVATAYFVGLEE